MLLLFDIDGTLLIGASRAHALALYEALSDVYGIADPASERVEAAGRTDCEIARAILLRRGVSAQRIDERLDDFRVSCAERFARTCPPSLAELVVEGLPELLESLSGRPDVILSLVTGNLEPIARLKLARAGLGRYFPAGQGGFGSDSEDRLDLPPLARRRAGRPADRRRAESGGRGHDSRHNDGADARGEVDAYPRRDTVVIGDTPRDVACARADELRCIAVTSGPYRAEQLTDADAVARDTRELGRLLDGVLDDP